ncbi:MAG: hypothetical protein GC162_16880 [Planctomycetes bacterium]|nr:hypothetical protein [Planctomycetota bacterium]
MAFASATLQASLNGSAAASAAGVPLVFVDGQPDLELSVERFTQIGPLDVRSASLLLRRDEAGYEQAELERARRRMGRPVMIAMPVCIAGGAARLLPLMQGRITSIAQRLDRATDQMTLNAVCGWHALLDEPIDTDTWNAPLTLRQAIDAINERTGVDLTADLIPPEALARPAGGSHGAPATIGAWIERLCRTHHTHVRRMLRWDGHRIVERRELRLNVHGRPIRLLTTQMANPAGATHAIRAVMPLDRPVKLIALAAGQRVESTFDLFGGWNPALESAADESYTRSASSDFDTYANVFRLWVLNEDGAFAGPAFDLTAFFDEGRSIPATPVRFVNALTMDDAGRSIGVAAEVSVDGGATWARYAGHAQILPERAAVYFDDDALPAAFLAACKSGSARVRVTASLTNPLATETTRWVGNPFAGSFTTKRFDVSADFAYQRVAPSSRHYDEVRHGDRSADERDDRAKLSSLLAERAGELSREPAQAVIDLVGPMLSLRIGDQLDDVNGRIGLVLMRCEHRFDAGLSETTWRREAEG